MKFEKVWLSFDEQADLLMKERGLIADRENLIRHLKEVGYYRLSGYWYIFKRCNAVGAADPTDERFVEGTTFEEIWSLYTFDRQLRLITLDAIERVEVYFRTQLAYELAKETGAFGYLDKRSLPRLDKDGYDNFMSHCKSEYVRSREPFVLHFREKYGDAECMPPYWIMVNIMDFGTMLRLYRGASIEIRNRIANSIGVSARVLESWLITLNTTRNICAHHGRLWNRGLGTRPTIPTAKKYPEWHEPFEIRSDNLFGVLTILSFLLERVAPDTSWRAKLFKLLETRTIAELNRMGFTEGWQKSPLWKPWVESDGSGAEESVSADGEEDPLVNVERDSSES